MTQKDHNRRIENSYRPQIFEADDMKHARQIILTEEQGTTTAERWLKETTYLIEQIGDVLKPTAKTCILDYGCGVGRLSKALIETFHCWVLGVDISLSMRQMAPGYVGSERFSVCTPESFEVMAEKGLALDHAVSVWVLQHCLNPISDIFRIKGGLRKKGLFFVVNNHKRAVPTDQGWLDDGLDIRGLLRRHFMEISASTLPESVTTPQISQHTFTSVLQAT